MANRSPQRTNPARLSEAALLEDLLARARAEDQALLDRLLTDELPDERSLLRPARLISASEQRSMAMRSLRVRTWVDTALLRAERALVLAAVIAFCYWFADGYGRDWLHAWGTAQARAEAADPTPTVSLGIPHTAPAAAAPRLPALPFTAPDPAAPPAQPAADFLAPQAAAARPAAAELRPLRFAIPSLGLDSPVKEVFVVDGVWEVAEYAVGYHHGSALPGNIGNMVVSGHAGLRGAVFRDLGRLKAGDEVIVENGGWRYVYRVRTAVNVWPTQVEVMDPTPTAVLTLITCTNWDTQRLVVIADLYDARPLT